MTANVYLSAYLAPLAPWLSRPDVTDVLINRPGEVWRFDENQEEVSLLNIGEIASRAHEANHLMTNTYELRHYLQQFKAQFLNA